MWTGGWISGAALCSALLKKLEAYGGVVGDDLLLLPAFCKKRRGIPSDLDLPRGDGGHPFMCLVTEGWDFSYHLLRDGSRQVIDFRIPGDFIGIASAMLRRRQNMFATITEVEIGEFDPEPMIGMLQSGGSLAKVNSPPHLPIASGCPSQVDPKVPGASRPKL